MKRLILFVGVLFFSVTVMAFVPPQGSSFWYGEETPEGNPIVLGVEFDIQGKTCDELWDPSRQNPGIVQQIVSLMQTFDNNIPGEPPVTISKPDKFWDGYTLLGCAGGGCAAPPPHDPDVLYGALLVDMDGQYVRGWLRDDMNGIPAKLLPGGYVMGGQGGGFGGEAVVMLDWDGNLVWEWEVIGGTWHHDFNRKNSPVGYYAPGMYPKTEGKTLVLARHIPEDEYGYPKSWVPEGHPAVDTSHISNFPLRDDAFYIVDKKGRIQWQWFAADHFEQMGFSDLAKEGIMNVRLGRQTPRGDTDWTHFNNVNWLGDNKWYRAGDERFHPDNIIFDSRSSSMIGIIAHDDNPGEWNEGDIIWTVGPEYGPGTPWESLGQIIGLHTAHMIPDSLPGGGNIILFDNGGRSVYGAVADGCQGVWPSALRDYSRILEFDPITLEVVWEYKNTEDQDPDEFGDYHRKFFSSFISSVQRLPNGNTLICEGNQARVIEVTPEGEIAWEYNAASEPGGPGVIGQALYRAYRYPKSWAPDY